MDLETILHCWGGYSHYLKPLTHGPCPKLDGWTDSGCQWSSHNSSPSEVRLGRLRFQLELSEKFARSSWELGTRAQAVLELNASIYSVFSTHPQPPPADIPTNLTSGLQPVLDIARNVVSNRANVNNNTQGAQPLMPDGSAADPASIGIAVLLANWTQQDGQDYAGAAKDQLDFLYQNVPKTIDGAISHRVSELQLW